jgi:hypothetical protein
MKSFRYFAFLTALPLGAVAFAQASDPLRRKVRAYRKAHDVEIVRELSDFPRDS